MRTIHLTMTAFFLVAGIVLGFGSFVINPVLMLLALISFMAALMAAKLADQN